MITIKKGKVTTSIPNDEVMSAQDTSDGLYIKFKDGSELFLRNIAIGVSQIKAIPVMIFNSKAPNLTIDLNNSVRPIVLE
jgi:hypothetical protein